MRRYRTASTLVLLAALPSLFASACGGLSRSTTSVSSSPSPPVVYGFAGLNSSENVEQVEGIRATFRWTVEPVIVPGYSVSTWIAFAVATPGQGISNRIAQIGWIETDSAQPHVFWEWGTSTSNHKQIGRAVESGVPLNVEVDIDRSGNLTFIADNIALGTATVPWAPTAIGAFAETHTATEYLPGSSTQPETLTDVQEKVAGNWLPYSGRVLTTDPHFRVRVSPDNSVLIWDVRQPT
jgi:hypothetical protein